MVAQFDDLLFHGVRPAAEVAILYPRSSFLWDSWGSQSGQVCMCCCTSSMVAHSNDYTVEAFGLYTALTTDSNIPVDFIDEDALLEPERLARFKMILVTQPNVPAAGQQGLLAWTRKKRGTLVTVSNAASADEFNTPSAVISDALGVREENRGRRVFLDEDDEVVAGNGTVQLGGGEPQPFVAMGVRGAVSLSGGASAKVLGKFADGAPALVETAVGSGTALRFAWMPGVSYHFTGRAASTRGLLAQLAARAGVVPAVSVSAAQVEAPLLLSGHGALLTLLNFRSSTQPPPPAEDLAVNVTLPFEPRSVESAEHAALNFTATPSGDGSFAVRFRLPLLEFGDMVALAL